MNRAKVLVGFLLLTLVTASAWGDSSRYQVKPAEDRSFIVDNPVLPSLNGYNRKQAAQILAAHKGEKGHARVERIVGNFEALKFYRAGLLKEWAARQGEFPKAIFIRGGIVTIKEVADDNPGAIKLAEDGSYLLTLPLIVSQDGVLVIDAGVELRLSEERGAFIINAGGLFVFDSKVIAWREKNATAASYSGNKKAFRPFLTALGGSFTYLVDSHFESLGYQGRQAYGISFVTHSDSALEVTPENTSVDVNSSPEGWIIGSVFVDMYFGFYCYEADDIALVNNRYINNIVYGIDPHDRSRRLIIANNVVSGTKIKHGIIVSREVNDSFIFNNRSFDNNRSGIMLDRSSENNVIASNTVYDNGGDGITLYESSHNLIWDNKIHNNREHGIRVRNSLNVSVQQNTTVNNTGNGVYFHIRNLNDHTYRDLQLDPYDMQVSGNVVGGIISGNRGGAIFAENFDSLLLANLRLANNSGRSGSIGLLGDLEFIQSQVIPALWGQEKSVLVEKITADGS